MYVVNIMFLTYYLFNLVCSYRSTFSTLDWPRSIGTPLLTNTFFIGKIFKFMVKEDFFALE